MTEFENQGSDIEYPNTIMKRICVSGASVSVLLLEIRMKVKYVFKFPYFNLNLAILFGKSFK